MGWPGLGFIRSGSGLVSGLPGPPVSQQAWARLGLGLVGLLVRPWTWAFCPCLSGALELQDCTDHMALVWAYHGMVLDMGFLSAFKYN